MSLVGAAMDHPNRVGITAPSGDSSNRLATTAFVTGSVSSGAKTNFIWIDRNNVNQTGLADGVFTKIQFNNKQSDVDGVFDAVTNFRYTPNVAGTFMVSGLLGLVSTSVFLDVAPAIFKNGAVLFQGAESAVAAAAGLTYFGGIFNAMVKMNGTTDFLEIFSFASSSGAAAYSINGNGSLSFLTAQKIGP